MIAQVSIQNHSSQSAWLIRNIGRKKVVSKCGVSKSSDSEGIGWNEFSLDRVSYSWERNPHLNHPFCLEDRYENRARFHVGFPTVSIVLFYLSYQC